LQRQKLVKDEQKKQSDKSFFYILQFKFLFKRIIAKKNGDELKNDIHQ